MKPLPRRMPSKAAKWALRIAVFVPVLALISILAHRGESVDTPTFLVLLAIIALIALLALVFVFLAFRSLWVKGKRGGRRATWALFIVAIVGAPYIYAAALALARPTVTDVSTDLIAPPVFQTELRLLGDNAMTVVAGEIVDGYPDITGRRYNATADVILEQVLLSAEERGWEILARRGRVGANDEVFIEFAHKSRLLGMPKQIIARITDEGETTFLDLRSQSQFISHDLGSNAATIREFIADIDFNLVGQIVR